MPKPELDWASGCARPLARDSTRLGGCTFTCSVRVPSKAGSRSVVIAVPPDGKELIVARHRLMIEPTMDYTAAATLRRFPLLLRCLSSDVCRILFDVSKGTGILKI